MNGAIVVYKEKNLTSRDVINKLNHILNTKAIGHIGTLDPLAEGVLVCLIGKYTKLCDVLVSHDKEYIASFKLGLLTDTLDIAGKILKEEKINVQKEILINTLNSFIGPYHMEVPIYSAIKVNGKKLYEYARNNESVILPIKDTTIYDIKLLDINNDEVTISCHVSKGTYIRSLIRDIGIKLGTNATMTSLIRTKLGKYDIKDAYSLEDIQNNHFKYLNIRDLLDLEEIPINEETLKKVLNGARLTGYSKEYVLFTYNNEDIALYHRDNQIYKMFIKINN